MLCIHQPKRPSCLVPKGHGACPASPQDLLSCNSSLHPPAYTSPLSPRTSSLPTSTSPLSPVPSPHPIPRHHASADQQLGHQALHNGGALVVVAAAEQVVVVEVVVQHCAAAGRAGRVRAPGGQPPGRQGRVHRGKGAGGQCAAAAAPPTVELRPVGVAGRLGDELVVGAVEGLVEACGGGGRRSGQRQALPVPAPLVASPSCRPRGTGTRPAPPTAQRSQPPPASQPASEQSPASRAAQGPPPLTRAPAHAKLRLVVAVVAGGVVDGGLAVH
jgi:hypothetical protein